MLVADLDDYLDLPDDVPGPALRAAERLGRIVHAATAGDAGVRWTSALPCARRPGNRACAGRIVILRSDPPAPVHWWCADCGDDGSIRKWEGSPYDLRRRTLAVAEVTEQTVVPDDVAAVLRELLMLDADVERRVFAMAAGPAGAVLSVTPDELDELVDSVAAEANHEGDRRRRRTLDAAYDLLSVAADRMRG